MKWMAQVRDRAAYNRTIVRVVGEELDLDPKMLQAVVQMILDELLDTIASERRLELAGFGVFEVTYRTARTARNPHSGEAVEVPEQHVVTFSPGKELHQRINGEAGNYFRLPGPVTFYDQP